MPTKSKRQSRAKASDAFSTASLASPQDEKAYLAALFHVLVENAEQARPLAALVNPEAFTVDEHRVVFGVFLDALRVDRPAMGDVTSILRRAEQAARDDYTDARQLLVGFAKHPVTAWQGARLAAEAADVVAGYWLQRQAITAMSEGAARVRDGETSGAIASAITQLQRVQDAAQHLEPAGDRLVLVRASDIKVSAVNWLWPQRIVGDGLTIITGPVGISKSLISVDVAARVTTAGKWPDGTGHAPQGSVILFGAEDDAGKVVVPRLTAAGADLARVHVCQGIAGNDTADEHEQAAVILERHIGQLRAALDDVDDCRLIVFDPLPDYIAGDENNSAEVRAALVPLARLAQERNVAVVAVLHQNKKNDLTTVQRIAGSGAFAQVARVVLAIGTHPDDAEKETGKRRVMLVSKNNYGERDVGQAYEIETRANGQPGLVWQAGTVTMDADEIARKPTGGREHESRRGEAVDALRDLLAAGEQHAGTLTARLQDAGLGRRQIDHAANVLNVIKSKHRDGWYWRLPTKAAGEAVAPQPDPAFAACGLDATESFNRT